MSYKDVRKKYNESSVLFSKGTAPTNDVVVAADTDNGFTILAFYFSSKADEAGYVEITFGSGNTQLTMKYWFNGTFGLQDVNLHIPKNNAMKITATHASGIEADIRYSPNTLGV